MEGVIKVGQLKRIQASVNKFIREKSLNHNAVFEWNQNIIFISKGRGQLIPVKINNNFVIEKPMNTYTERAFIENQLKFYFLTSYSSSKPKK